MNAQLRDQKRCVVYRRGACQVKPKGDERARHPARSQRARHVGRLVGRRGWIPRAEGAPRTSALPPVTSARELVLVLLDAAELEVLEFGEERAQVRCVRELARERFADRPLPPFDPRHLVFAIGVIATMAGSDFSSPGLASLCFSLLSPSALAEYERAAGRGSGAERNQP